jgi:hypothetical protein
LSPVPLKAVPWRDISVAGVEPPGEVDACAKVTAALPVAEEEQRQHFLHLLDNSPEVRAAILAYGAERTAANESSQSDRGLDSVLHL